MTSRSRTYSTEGVVVRQRDIGEADRLLWIITPEHGIIRSVARSARKPGSKLGGHIDLLRHVALSMRTGRTLDQVSQVETISGFIRLRQDLVRASTGSYIAELAERFSVEGGSNRQLFELLGVCAGLLADDGQDAVAPTLVRVAAPFDFRLYAGVVRMCRLRRRPCAGRSRVFVGARRPGLPRLQSQRQRRSSARERGRYKAAAFPAHRRVDDRRAIAD